MKWDWTRSFPDIFYCIIKYVIALHLVTGELSSLQPVFYINTKTSKPLQEAAFCYPWLRTEVNQNLKYNKKNKCVEICGAIRLCCLRLLQKRGSLIASNVKKKAFPYSSTQNIGVHSVNAVRPASHNVAFRNQSCKLQKDVLAFCIVPAPRTAEAELVKEYAQCLINSF